MIALVALLTAGLLAGGSSTVAQTTGKVSGSIVDQVGGLLPYVTVELTERRTRRHHETRTDQIGHFEIEGLAPGEYVFEARLAAFVPIEERVTLSAGDHLEQNITLQLAEWTERIVVTADDSDRVLESTNQNRARAATAGQACERAAVGGDVRPPTRVRDARPVYPASLRSAGIQGAVVVAGRIGAEGRLQDARVTERAHPELAAAAVAAIAQWQWTEPRLDCVPVDGHLTITVEFKVER